MTIVEAVETASFQLERAGIDTATEDAWLLMAHVVQRSILESRLSRYDALKTDEL